jgi:glycosyltransferase involved in cell wall biosynthesis
MQEGGLRIAGLTKRHLNGNPLISVITVVYNGETTLERTVQSVIGQTYENMEYILVDGNSKDATLDIIKKYAGSIEYWISEADNGIYDAMNKGIALASGDYIAILSSGDWYEPETCSIVAERIRGTKNDVYYGMIRMIDPDGTLLSVRGNTIDYIGMEMIAHPTCFISKEVYSRKRYETKYCSSSDYDFILQLVHEGRSFSFIEKVMTNFLTGGMSSNIIGNIETNKILFFHKRRGRIAFYLRSIYFFLLKVMN